MKSNATRLMVFWLASVLVFAQSVPTFTCYPPRVLGAAPTTKLIVSNAATSGSGTKANPWKGWEPAVNALPNHAHITFPLGHYKQTQEIAYKFSWTVVGDGKKNSLIEAYLPPNGRSFYSYAPLNCSTAVDFNMSGIGIIDKTGSIWLTNGEDNTPGAQKQFTNRITIERNQISPGPNGIGIIDEGYAQHTISRNNMNGGKNYIYVAGILNATISENEMEGASGDGIVTEYRTFHSKQGVGANYFLAIRDNLIVTHYGHAISNGYVHVIENNLLATPKMAITCGIGLTGAPYQVGNSNSYAPALLTDCKPKTPFFHHDLDNTQTNIVSTLSTSSIAPTNTISLRQITISTLRPMACEDIVIADFKNLSTTSFVSVSPSGALLTGGDGRAVNATTFQGYVADANSVVIRHCNGSRTTTSIGKTGDIYVKIEPVGTP